MANFGFNIAKSQLLGGQLDLDTDTLRMLLLKTYSTADGTLADYDDLQAFLGDSGITEADAASYGRVTVTTPAITTDDANDRGELDFDNVVFSGLGDGSGTDGTGSENTIVAAVLYKQVGADDTSPGDDIPIALYDIADTQTDGTDFTLSVGSDGVLHVT